MRPTVDGRDTRNARGRATVAAIEREALRLAQREGVDALTVDEICAQVGISQRSFFNHFDSKDDALLGWALPQLSDERVAEYLADDSVGVLVGAMGLVEVPREFVEDLPLVLGRLQLLMSTPSLAERQSARLRPLVQKVEGVVLRKLETLAAGEPDAASLRRAAVTITAIAAALLVQPPGGGGPQLPDPARTAGSLDELRWIWDRLL